MVQPKRVADSTLVRLSCVDDDNQGRPLEVLWEKELDPMILTGEAWETVILPAPQEVVRRVEGMESDPEVEKIAVEVAMQYERDKGRHPVSVEKENCGWDLTSLLGGEPNRYIEVKGRAGMGRVALTPNEWIKAHRFGKEYWLYVVVNCKTTPELYIIQDPASQLIPKEEVSVVRYIIGQGDWQGVAETT